MDINQFLEELRILKIEIEKIVEKIENNTSAGISEMPNLLKKIQTFLPDWFYFIEQTKIGEKQEILKVLTDIINGVNAGDGVFLADALLFGLGGLIEIYELVIKEALYGE